MIPHDLFEGQEPTDDIAAAAFAPGPLRSNEEYTSGILLASWPFAAGRFLVNSFPILANVDAHPVADRLLLNVVRYANGFCREPQAELPSDFESRLQRIGYVNR